ncbi:fibronectin type III domain-containing protein [Roseobacter sp.]|uniref:fibronectin type III domain-containing protein n=1 Tax=Roseobacter sp. TaxID=1907202 RepID=UPI002966E90F|nr:fibronectin type III domain-containing protein [Roseobacter sp.]MDW3181220.1 fibronectin type III domain-containing protein [Roseobacter sp.]
MPTFSFRNTSTGAVTTLAGNVPFNVSGLLPDGTYTVQALSDEAPATITIATASAVLPDQVADLSVTEGDGEIALTWSAPADGGSAITDYLIEVDSGSGFAAVTDGVSANTSFTHTGLTNGTAYTYRVAAVTAVGTGSFSATASGTPFSLAIPAEAEADAQGHWFFGTDNVTDSDMITGQALTANGAQPTRSSGYLSILGQGNGLLSHVADSADITFCAVVRRPQGASRAILGGVMDSGAGVEQAGWSPFTWDTNDLHVRNKGGTEIVELDNSSPLDAFYFLAVSLSATGEHVYFRGTLGTSIVSSGNAGRGTVRAVNVALGDVHFDAGSFVGSFDCAEMIVWQSAKSVAELEAILQRSRDRLAARGITVLAP